MNYIISIIAAVLFAFTFVEVLGVHKVIKRFYNFAPGRRLKPLDCVTCMSFWSCIVLLILPDQCSTVVAALLGAAYLGGKIK
jgi:hypothetical protein